MWRVPALVIKTGSAQGVADEDIAFANCAEWNERKQLSWDAMTVACCVWSPAY